MSNLKLQQFQREISILRKERKEKQRNPRSQSSRNISEMHSLSRVIFLIAAVDALVITAVFVIEIVLAAAGATGATGSMMGRWKLRRDHRRKRRRGRYPAMRRQSRDCRIAQESVRLVHVLPIHHIPFEIVHGIHDDGIQYRQ